MYLAYKPHLPPCKKVKICNNIYRVIGNPIKSERAGYFEGQKQLIDLIIQLLRLMKNMQLQWKAPPRLLYFFVMGFIHHIAPFYYSCC